MKFVNWTMMPQLVSLPSVRGSFTDSVSSSDAFSNMAVGK